MLLKVHLQSGLPLNKTVAVIFTLVFLVLQLRVQHTSIIMKISEHRLIIIRPVWSILPLGLRVTMMDFKLLYIADLPVKWQIGHIEFVKDFLSDTMDEPVLSLEFRDGLICSYSVQYTEKAFTRFLKTASGEMLFADDFWRDVTVYGTTKDSEYTLPLAAICSKFAYYNTVLSHSSLVDYNGNGVLFLGPSGIGKTTQAQLWNKFKCADIINGDKAFIRVIDDCVYAYGLPWKGSSPYSLNRRVELKAIVVLSQSDNNTIVELKDDSLEGLVPHVFFPHWDKTCLDKSLETLSGIIKNVPIYSLKCRPDEEAVQLVYKTVFG